MQKPSLSYWQIWNMSFGFFGIQMAFALQGANVSRIFQTLGADVSNLAIYWLAGPVTGLIVQPLIGHFSDRTWGPMGRRRPYFLAGAILSTLALFIMPNSPTLWAAVVMLWVLDASINVSMEPFRAFVGDMLPSRQRTQGFATQTLLIGAGALIASAMPWILTNVFAVASTAPEGIIPDAVKYSFYIGGAALFLAVGWTIVTTKEYTPEELAKFKEPPGVFRDDAVQEEIKQRSTTYFALNGFSLLMAALVGSWGIAHFDAARELFVLTATAGGVGLFFLVHAVVHATSHPVRNLISIIAIIAGAPLLFFGIAYGLVPILTDQDVSDGLSIMSLVLGPVGAVLIGLGLLVRPPEARNIVSHIISDLVSMPKVMRRLAVVQFFSWFALFIMWVYATPAVTSFHYGTSDPTSIAYNEGANWVGWLFATYNGVSAIWALLLPVVAARTNRRLAHGFSLGLGAISFAAFLVIREPVMLLLPMIGIGMAWGSILTMPYAILSDALPAKKMGIYMGIFNFFIVLPQMVVAGVMGPILVSFLGEQAILTFLIAAASWVLAAASLLFVPGRGEIIPAQD